MVLAVEQLLSKQDFHGVGCVKMIEARSAWSETRSELRHRFLQNMQMSLTERCVSWPQKLDEWRSILQSLSSAFGEQLSVIQSQHFPLAKDLELMLLNSFCFRLLSSCLDHSISQVEAENLIQTIDLIHQSPLFPTLSDRSSPLLALKEFLLFLFSSLPPPRSESLRTNAKRSSDLPLLNVFVKKASHSSSTPLPSRHGKSNIRAESGSSRRARIYHPDPENNFPFSLISAVIPHMKIPHLPEGVEHSDLVKEIQDFFCSLPPY